MKIKELITLLQKQNIELDVQTSNGAIQDVFKAHILNQEIVVISSHINSRKIERRLKNHYILKWIKKWRLNGIFY